jgi:hypothetical protein
VTAPADAGVVIGGEVLTLLTKKEKNEKIVKCCFVFSFSPFILLLIQGASPVTLTRACNPSIGLHSLF